MAAEKMESGTIFWTDLTIGNADEVRNFYSEVVGWKFEFVDMGEYSDYSMLTPNTKKTVAGICHATGPNTNLPAQWMIYITVENIKKSIEQCEKLGGKLISELKNYGNAGRYCVIKDPAGAVCALFQQNISEEK
jgi:uncharacterized protein